MEDQDKIDFENNLNKVRNRRNFLLSQSDLCVFSDIWDSYTQVQKDAWKKYRQDLRDMPETFSKNPIWPPTWPVKPE